MTRTEAIKICKQVRKYFKGGKLAIDDTDAIYGALTMAIEALSCAESQCESAQVSARWIPVSERLPEMDGKYLITEVDGCVTCDYFRLENGDWRITFPIAWMSLPEPYTEKRGD